jgi:hypothetical protein
MGAVGVPLASPQFPMPVLVSPSAVVTLNTPPTLVFRDATSYQNLKTVEMLINTAIDGRHACYVAFVPSGPGSGSLYLVDDAGDAAGPYQGLVLPGSGTVGNSQCSVSGTGSSVSGNGTQLKLTLWHTAGVRHHSHGTASDHANSSLMIADNRIQS